MIERLQIFYIKLIIMKNKTILITGGLGFIGGHFVRQYHQLFPEVKMVVVDKKTYAADLDRISDYLAEENLHLLKKILPEKDQMEKIFQHYQPVALSILQQSPMLTIPLMGQNSFSAFKCQRNL